MLAEINKRKIPSETVKKLQSFAKKSETQKEFKAICEATSINQFVTRLSNLVTKIDVTDYEIGKGKEECSNKIKGDMFEVFTIAFLEAFGGDRSLFIHSIEWAKRDQKGYDFTGINKYNTPVSIQSKFVANATETFDRGKLETFFGHLPEGTVIKAGAPSRVLFTTACKFAPYYLNEQRDSGMNFLIIDRKTIKKFTDKHLGFWNQWEELGELIFK